MALPNDQLADYYARRAQEYEQIYEKPERQCDLASLRSSLASLFAQKQVLEVACGTGYWTQVVAEATTSVVATDVNDEVLQIARSKNFTQNNVSFRKTDAFALASLNQKHFTAGLAVFWWSHLRKSEIAGFLAQFHGIMAPGALICFIDNRFVSGSSTPISRTDEDGNTYQIRHLKNGEQFEVLKNFPTRNEIVAALSGSADQIQWRELDYYWFLSYYVTGQAPK